MPRESGHHAAGGDGDVPRSEVRTFAGVDELQGAHRLVVVGERFAHAHDDDIGDLTEFSRQHILGDDLVGGERAHHSLRAAGAEDAAHRAADLRRDALGEAAGGGNQHRLDRVAVFESDEQFFRAVRRFGNVENFGGGDREFPFEVFAEIFRQRGRFVPNADIIAIERLENLVGAESTHPPLREDRFPFFRKYAPCLFHDAEL